MPVERRSLEQELGSYEGLGPWSDGLFGHSAWGLAPGLSGLQVRAGAGMSMEPEWKQDELGQDGGIVWVPWTL